MPTFDRGFSAGRGPGHGDPGFFGAPSKGATGGLTTLGYYMEQMLEPVLLPGALVVADDLDLFPDVLAPYLAYVRDPANGYVSVRVPIGDAMELSARTR